MMCAGTEFRDSGTRGKCRRADYLAAGNGYAHSSELRKSHFGMDAKESDARSDIAVC